MFILASDLEEVANSDITSDEYPVVFCICYYERFWKYSLVLKIKEKELMWAFAKIISTKGGFREWEDWDILKVDSLEEIDLSSEKALKEQTKRVYKDFLKKRKRRI